MAENESDNEELQEFTPNQKQFLEIYTDKNCSIAKTCKAMNISRRAYYNWADANPRFKQAVHDLKEDLKDFAESQLQKAIKKGRTAFLNPF